MAMRFSRLVPLLVGCILIYLVVFYNVSNESDTGTGAARISRLTKEVVKAARPTPPPRNVVIYAATKFFNMDVTTKRFLSECHSSKGWCRISEDLSDIPVADAVLFHNADYDASKVPSPRVDKPHVLWSLESPANDWFRPGPHIINWTMTPRRDADIWYPYGHFVKLDTPIVYDMDSIWSMKRHDIDATWLASNCYTSNRRNDLIDSIVKHGVTADLYGSCGRTAPLDCAGVDKQGYDCVIELIKVLPEHDETTGFCQLCRRLQFDNDVTSKSYEDISEWNSKGICYQGIADRFL